MRYTGRMSEKLTEKRCVPCEEGSGGKPLAKAAAARLMHELEGWTLAKDGGSIAKEIVFKNFDKAMDFVNMVADLAEQEGHHPDIAIHYNTVVLDLSTHAVSGLTENDFILASKIDAIRL